MGRVPYVSADELHDRAGDLPLRPNHSTRALANAPEAMRTFMRVSRWIRHESALDPRLRELAILQVGYAAGSAYVFSHHLKIGPEYGVTTVDIEAVVAESAGRQSELGALEQAVLRAARELTLDVRLSEDTWRAIEDGIGPEQAIELVLVIGFYNHNARWMAALELDVEPEYAVLLDPYWPPVVADGG